VSRTLAEVQDSHKDLGLSKTCYAPGKPVSPNLWAKNYDVIRQGKQLTGTHVPCRAPSYRSGPNRAGAV
jgi:hypothetical protein